MSYYILIFSLSLSLLGCNSLKPTVSKQDAAQTNTEVDPVVPSPDVTSSSTSTSTTSTSNPVVTTTSSSTSTSTTSTTKAPVTTTSYSTSTSSTSTTKAPVTTTSTSTTSTTRAPATTTSSSSSSSTSSSSSSSSSTSTSTSSSTTSTTVPVVNPPNPGSENTSKFKSVALCGALPDDAMDDTAAIQRCLDVSVLGDIVYLPRGRYLVSSPISLKSNVKMRGEEQSQTILLSSSVMADTILRISNATGVEVSRLTIDASNSRTSMVGIAAATGSRHYLHDLTIKNFAAGALGIHFQADVTDSEISNNTISNIGVGTIWGGGIRISWRSSRVKIIGNRIQNTGRGGIFCNDGAADPIIQRNTVSGSGGEGLGIEVWVGCHRAIIEDNVIDHWLSVSGVSQAAVRRNVVSDKSGILKFIGIELVESTGSIFTDNIVDDGQQMGISESGGGGNGELKYIYWGYNKIVNMETWAVQVQGEIGGASYQYFYRNEFANTRFSKRALDANQGHGFRINGNSHHLTMDSNKITSNGYLGVQFAATSMSYVSFVNNDIRNNPEVVNWRIDDMKKITGMEWLGNLVNGNNPVGDFTTLATPMPSPKALIDSFFEASVNQPISFQAMLPAGSAAIGHVLWDFNDGLPSESVKASYAFTKPGTYRVTLVVWDVNHRSHIAEKNILIK